MKNNFRIAPCCMNCEHRKLRVKTKIYCETVKSEYPWLWVTERGICDLYTPSTSPNLIRQEKRLLPEELKEESDG